MKYELTSKAMDIMKATGYETGVHAPARRSTGNKHGTSEAGLYTRAAQTHPNEKRPAVLDNVQRYKGTAKEHHKQVLGEMRSMKKPNLPKNDGYEFTAKAEEIMKGQKQSFDDPGYMGYNAKGVHRGEPVRNNAGTAHAHSQSHAGHLVNAAHAIKDKKLPAPYAAYSAGHGADQAKARVGAAKQEHKRVLSEMRSMKKPNLPKNDGYELTAKAEAIMKGGYQPVEGLKGVHTSGKGQGSSSAGLSVRGSDKNLTHAKEAHKKVLGEMRSMKKPALKGEYALTEKAEAILKAASGIKGVHEGMGSSGQSTMGMTIPSKHASTKHKQASYSQAKGQAKQVLSEIKGMKKPKIP